MVIDMTPMVLLIEHRSHCTPDDVKVYLKTEYPSMEYLKGFSDGYLFDCYRLLTLAEYQKMVNQHAPSLAKFWVHFVYVVGDEQESDD